MVSLPYSFNERVNHETRNNKSGLGDISLSGYYQLVNNRRMVFKDRLLVQSLWVGTGIKLATGKYSQSDKNTANDNANLFQLGTGSNDFNIAAMYDIRLQDIGINLYGNYKMTTVNAYNYKYGNKFNINAQAYYKFRIKNKLTIAPNAGIQYEQTNNDFDKGFNVATSGGNLLLGTAGIEAAFGKVAIGGNLQTPFCQNLANGIVKANNRVMAHVAFIF